MRLHIEHVAIFFLRIRNLEFTLGLGELNLFEKMQ